MLSIARTLPLACLRTSASLPPAMSVPKVRIQLRYLSKSKLFIRDSIRRHVPTVLHVNVRDCKSFVASRDPCLPICLLFSADLNRCARAARIECRYDDTSLPFSSCCVRSSTDAPIAKRSWPPHGASRNNGVRFCAPSLSELLSSRSPDASSEVSLVHYKSPCAH